MPYAIPGNSQIPNFGDPPGDMNKTADMLGLLTRVLAQQAGAYNSDPGGNASNVTAVQKLIAASSVVCIPPSGNTGGSVDAAEINAALTSGANAVALLPGTYWINAPLLMPAGSSMTGVPCAADKYAGSCPTVIKLAAGSNCHMVVPSGRATYLANIELDGNKAGQTSGSGCGISYGAGSDWSVAERCYIHHQRHDGIAIAGAGTHLEAIRVLDTSVQDCGASAITTDGYTSDHLIRGCLIGSSYLHNLDIASYVTHIEGNDIWSSATGCGIWLADPGQGNMVCGNGIDRNYTHGLMIQTQLATVIGNTFHSNSQAGNNLYSDICADNSSTSTAGGSITANNFWVDVGESAKPKYHIQFVGTAGTGIKAHSNNWSTGSAATANMSGPAAAKDTNETG